MIIRDTQFKALEESAVDNFVLDMFRHCQEFSPHLCKTLKEEQLKEAIREGIRRAETHGFMQRGPVRFYLDLMIVFGSSFDTDPQYPWAAEILAQIEETSEIQRSEALHEKTAEYLEKVDGEKNAYTLEALDELSSRIKAGLTFRRDTFDADILNLMKEIHPRKYKETGEESLRQLVENSRKKAIKDIGFKEPRAVALIVVLAFAFGHQFDHDPFLPWISRTLNKENETLETKAEELERRAVIWLDAVLKNAKENK
jgi:hypothetical protein